MPLLLCRQKAEVPLCHDRLNINIWSEQELCYIIYNYPFVCLKGFCEERLFDWMDKELKLRQLAERLKMSLKRGEPRENQLLMILQECNYYGTSEVMAFRQRMSEIVRYSPAELIRAEGLTLYNTGSYNSAYELWSEAIRLMEQDFRRRPVRDDAALREHNMRKAGLYCDMAAARLQLFDEKGAAELLKLSESTFKNERAETMQYLACGTGELTEERKAGLISLREETRKKVQEGSLCREVLDIFEQDKSTALSRAGKLVASWKQQYRHM